MKKTTCIRVLYRDIGAELAKEVQDKCKQKDNKALPFIQKYGMFPTTEALDDWRAFTVKVQKEFKLQGSDTPDGFIVWEIYRKVYNKAPKAFLGKEGMPLMISLNAQADIPFL